MKRLAILLIASAALLAPSAALASGVVLKVQKATHLVAVTNGKTTKLVHSTAAARLHVGQRVAMKARTLRNGTLAASTMRVVGRTHKVHFRALLLKKERTRLVLSAGGAVIALNRGRTTASANDTTPQPGATVDVTATVDNNDDELDEDNVDVVSADAPGGAIEGKLTLGTGTVTIVSEHMALRLNVPTGFDLSQFKNGDEVLAKFTQNADGTLSLTSLSGDDNEQEANDNNDDNDDGDHGGGDHGGGDHGGGGGGGGGDD